MVTFFLLFLCFLVLFLSSFRMELIGGSSMDAVVEGELVLSVGFVLFGLFCVACGFELLFFGWIVVSTEMEGSTLFLVLRGVLFSFVIFFSCAEIEGVCVGGICFPGDVVIFWSWLAIEGVFRSLFSRLFRVSFVVSFSLSDV